jgi:predicted SAM-dependent methyltransferase
MATETDNCRHRLLKYCSGKGLDIGCGDGKIKPDAIGVDMDESVPANVRMDAKTLPNYSDNSFDFVYSSHCLEDIEDTESTLREWLRVIKPGGFLVLYMPDKDYYPNIGTLGANKNHKHDFYWEDLWTIMEKIGGVELIHHDRYSKGEWSFELVVTKLV